MKLPRWLRWRSDRELDEEIQAHLETEIAQNLERGLEPQEARYAALRRMGNTTRVRERAREGDPWFRFDSLSKDVRYALRSLRRNPGFTLAAVLSLALGIGVNSAIFSFSDALLPQPPDVPHPGELVTVAASTPQYQFDRLSYREYAAYRDRNRTMTGLMAETFRSFAVQSGDNEQPHVSFGDFVSASYFSVLGVAPAIGRPFLPEEDSPAARDVVALLSYQNWQVNFHSDPHIAGARIKLNGQPATVIGVLPADFRGTGNFIRSDLFVPLAAADRLFPSSKPLAEDGDTFLSVYGRLKPGVSARSAQAEFAALAPRLEKASSEGESQRRPSVLPIVASRMAADPDDARLIFLLLGIAAIVLLTGCMNVANLLLGRAGARVKEIAIRQSVGASRGRLIAQLLTESVVLAALGAGAGLLLAQWAIHSFAAVPISPDYPSSFPARLDARVLAYTLLAAGAAVLVSGLWPAVRATSVDLISPAKGVAGRTGSFRGRNVSVAVQTALAAMLLVSASLFVKSFLLAGRHDPGFRVENVLILSFNPSVAGYKGEQMRAFYQELEERVNALPGVRSAALGTHVPMGSDSQWNSVAPEGGAFPGQAPMSVMFDRVDSRYFSTMAVPILDGRPFDDRDRPGAPAVAVVNEALARRFWPHGGGTGRLIRFGDGPAAPLLQVVGIAGNGKYQAAIDKFEPYLYVPDRQLPPVGMTLFVHTAGDPAAMAPVLRRELRAVAPDMPASDIHTMREIFEVHGLLGARLMAQIVGATGAIGLALGVLGLYAVAAFLVSRRTREIGIRMALGASAGSVLRGVLASGARVAFAGIVIGLAGALAFTRYFAEFLDRVNPRDPAVFAGVAMLLFAVALAACWAPARRASRIDPAVILKYE